MFPQELLGYKQWVLWRRAEVNGRSIKIPISPWSGKAAACDRPQTWSTYKHVRYALRRFACDGVGFVFTKADPFCGIDLDQCRKPRESISAEALDLIDRIGSYTEVSPSGTGAHILLKARLSGTGRRKGKVEIYDSGRYFTITGKHVLGTPLDIVDRQETVNRILADLFLTPERPLFESASLDFNFSDQELIERAKRARGGDRFRRLWDGDTSDYGNDHSRADLALCRLLAFWTAGNAERIDRLFRYSGLMREKWDRLSGVAAYGTLTISTVLNGFGRRV